MTDEERKMVEYAVDQKQCVYKIRVQLEKESGMRAVKAYLIINNLLGIGDVLKALPDNLENLTDENMGTEIFILPASFKTPEEIYKNIDSISEIKEIDIELFMAAKTGGTSYDAPSCQQTNSQSKAADRSSIRVDVNRIDKIMKLDNSGEYFITCVKDKGKGFHPPKDSDYDEDWIQGSLMKTGGRGLFIISSLARIITKYYKKTATGKLRPQNLRSILRKEVKVC